jgi:hypothetical protein
MGGGSTPVLWLVLCAKILALYHGLHNRVKFASAQLEQFCTGMPLCCSRLHLHPACCCMGKWSRPICRVPDCWTAGHAGFIALIRHKCLFATLQLSGRVVRPGYCMDHRSAPRTDGALIERVLASKDPSFTTDTALHMPLRPLSATTPAD